MIDGNDFQTPSGPQFPPTPRSGWPAATSSGNDLYADLFSPPKTGTPSPALEGSAAVAKAPAASCDRFRPRSKPVRMAPACPTTLDEAGINLMTLADLLLKQLYLQGNTLGVQLARHVRLPFQLVEEALRFLKSEKCLEVLSGDLIGPASYRFNLTEIGRKRAHECFQQCRYVGPAPVSLEAYISQCRLQQVSTVECHVETLKNAFDGMIIRQGLLG